MPIKSIREPYGNGGTSYFSDNEEQWFSVLTPTFLHFFSVYLYIMCSNGFIKRNRMVQGTWYCNITARLLLIFDCLLNVFGPMVVVLQFFLPVGNMTQRILCWWRGLGIRSLVNVASALINTFVDIFIGDCKYAATIIVVSDCILWFITFIDIASVRVKRLFLSPSVNTKF